MVFLDNWYLIWMFICFIFFKEGLLKCDLYLHGCLYSNVAFNPDLSVKKHFFNFFSRKDKMMTDFVTHYIFVYNKRVMGDIWIN